MRIKGKYQATFLARIHFKPSYKNMMSWCTLITILAQPLKTKTIRSKILHISIKLGPMGKDGIECPVTCPCKADENTCDMGFDEAMGCQFPPQCTPMKSGNT